jgi:hypothetical protein
MNNPRTKAQEGSDNSKIEVISKIKQIALGEGPAECQICDRKLREGDELTAYAFRAAGNPIFEIGYVMCGDDEHAHPTEFMRGVHELVVTGRIGLCTDVSTQSSWLVLIEPEPVVASRPTENFARTIGEDATHNSDRFIHTYRDSSDDGPTPPFQPLHEHPPEHVHTVEDSIDYSQMDRTEATEHNEQVHQHATNQGGDE